MNDIPTPEPLPWEPREGEDKPVPSPGSCFAAALRLELAEGHGYPDVWDGDGIYAGRQKD